jgi:hypothetical protein
MYYEEVHNTLQEESAYWLERAQNANERATGRLCAERLKALEEAKLYLLDVEQVEKFKSPRFKLENFPPLPFHSLWIEFSGCLDFAYVPQIAKMHVDGNGMQRSIQAAPDEEDPLTDRSDKTLTQYRAVQIHTYSPPHHWGNFPENERLVTVLWWERKFRGHFYDHYTLSLTESAWPHLWDEHQHCRGGPEQHLHAMRLLRMTANLLYFLTAENVTLVRVTPEIRASKPKKEVANLPKCRKPYYVLPISVPRYRYKLKEAQAHSEGASGYHHSFTYDVTGHLRHLRDDRYQRNPDGSVRTIWIDDHKRGLAAGVYLPAIRRGSITSNLLEFDQFISLLESRK